MRQKHYVVDTSLPLWCCWWPGMKDTFADYDANMKKAPTENSAGAK